VFLAGEDDAQDPRLSPCNVHRGIIATDEEVGQRLRPRLVSLDEPAAAGGAGATRGARLALVGRLVPVQLRVYQGSFGDTQRARLLLQLADPPLGHRRGRVGMGPTPAAGARKRARGVESKEPGERDAEDAKDEVEERGEEADGERERLQEQAEPQPSWTTPVPPLKCVRCGGGPSLGAEYERVVYFHRLHRWA